MPLFLSRKGFGWPWCVRGRVRAVIMGLGLVPGNKVILTSGYMAWISVANRVSSLQRRCLRKINLEQRWEAKREGAFWVGLIQDLNSTCHGSSGSRGKRNGLLREETTEKVYFWTSWVSRAWAQSWFCQSITMPRIWSPCLASDTLAPEPQSPGL